MKKFKSGKISVIFILLAFLTLLSSSNTLASNELTIVNPYKNYQYNFKGNLHAHTNNSDGDAPAAIVASWYKNNGYYFYSFTDHDNITADPQIGGIVWLGTSEEDSNDGSFGHINHINIIGPITAGSYQDRINNAISQGGFSIFNHPSRSTSGHQTTDMINTIGAIGFEIYNGKDSLDSGSNWDTVLSADRTVWGFANDDAHSSTQRGTAYNMVNSNNPTPDKNEIINQIKAGNFYASRGLNLSIRVSGKTITASTTDGNKIRWKKESGEIIKTTSSKTDNYTPSGYEKYIRIEILDNQDTIKAWSQPLFITGDNIAPQTFAPKKAKAKINNKGRAKVKIYWKVTDDRSAKATVKIRIKRNIGKNKYKNVKLITHKSTAINKLRYSIWYTKKPGIYKFIVYATDKGNNPVKTAASNFIIVKR